MKNTVSFLLLIIFASLMLYSGCKDTISGEELDKRIIPDKNVSYAENIQPVLNIKCAGSGCHDDATNAGGITLTTWASTTLDPNVVFPGKPENSRLVWAIEGRSGVSGMPPIGYATLTINQITGIKTWIAEGAKNN